MATKKYFLAILISAIALAVVGCQTQDTEVLDPDLTPDGQKPPAVMVEAATPVATTEADPLSPTPIVFEPSFEPGECPFDVPDDLGPDQSVECGVVLVPADHFNPSPNSMRIAVVVLRDHRTGHHPDPLIVLAGGPGEKIVQHAPLLAEHLASIYRSRDLIIYDQRGIGFSEPALECPEWSAAQLDLLDEPDLRVIAETSFDSWMLCRDRLLEEGHDLNLFNTRQNAADVNAIRVALGYETINLFGGSYGSLLAQATMRDYPEGIRSVLMDSVLPLEKSLFVDVSVTGPEAILRLVRSCEADPDCQESFPNLETVLYEVIDRLDENPVPITVTNPQTGVSYDALLTGFTVRSNLMVFLYDTTIIPLLPKAIYDVYEGDYALMTQLRSLFLTKLDALSRGILFSVMCAEDLIGRQPDEYITLQKDLPSQLVGDRYPEEVEKYGVFGICKNWPVTEAESYVKEPVKSDIPTLVVSGEFDPVTPPGYGVLVAGNLSNASHFEFLGVGHSVIVSDDCARAMAAEFLDDPPGELDAGCMVGQGAAFATGEGLDDLAFEPVAIKEFGIEAIVPQGWIRAAPEYYVSPDRTIELVLKQKFEEPLESFLGRWDAKEMPDRLVWNSRTWSFYEFAGEGSLGAYGGHVAVSMTDEGYYLVLAVGPADRQAAMLQQLIRPILESFVPVAMIADEEITTVEEPVSETLTLVSFESPAFEIQGVVPDRWSEAAPGVSARTVQTGDQTLLMQKSYPGMSQADLLAVLLPALGIETLPESTGQLETPAFTWELYEVSVDAPGVGKILLDLALTETPEKPYLVLLQTLEADYTDLHETVFLPAVNALAPLE